MIISRSLLLRMRNVLDKSCRENQNPHFMFDTFFFWISCCLWGNVKTYSRAREITYDNTAHVHCRLDTLRMWNAYCFSTATMFIQTHLNVMFICTVHCLPCYTCINSTLSTVICLLGLILYIQKIKCCKVRKLLMFSSL